MTPFYNTPENNQAQNNIQADLFRYNSVQNTPKELNYFEKRVIFLKAKCSMLKNKTGALPYILEYLEFRANNDTGILIWCTQEQIAKDLGINRQTVIQCLLRAEREGLIATRRSGGFKKTNRYRVCYDIYEHDENLKNQVENIQLRKAVKALKTSLPLDVAPQATHTTNKTKKEEVSINTNIENTNFFEKQVIEEVQTVFETTEPIPLTDDLKFRKVTLNSIEKKTQLQGARYYEAIDRWEAAYRYKWKDPSIRRTIDHWNADFNKYCQYQKHWEDKKGSRMIAPIKRLMFNEQKKIKIVEAANMMPTAEWLEEVNKRRIKLGLNPRH
jgi:hypothetical protein